MEPLPGFSDFFKSFYYSNTYIPTVDLSEEGLAKHLLESVDREASVRARQLISEPKVQAVLSQPLSYDSEKINENNEILMKHGFKLLSSKTISNPSGSYITPFYSVIEHEKLDEWVIKSGASRVPKDHFTIGPENDLNEAAFFTQEDSILRIEMASRVAKVAQEAHIDVVVPTKKLVADTNLDGVTTANKRYCVFCKKIKILSANDTAEAIKRMEEDHQTEIARKMSIIIQKAGLVDAHFENIRLTPEGNLAFIDTEPAGLMVAKKPGLWNRFFGEKGASVEKCARIGLFSLMAQVSDVTDLGDICAKPGLEAFHKKIKNDYIRVSKPEFSKWKIALSVLSFGLNPLINAIVALGKTKLTKQIYEKIDIMKKAFQDQTSTYQTETERACKEKEHQKNLLPLQKQYYAYIEGVPFA